MIITIDLPPDVAERLARQASEDGQDLAGYVQGLATREVGGLGDDLETPLAALKSRPRPQTLEDVFGQWPGDESDEEVQAALDAIE